MAAGYVGVGIPARIIYVSNTTLFQVASDYLGDPLWWTQIALMNGLTDPMIVELARLKIPTAPPATATPTGILGA